MSFIQKKTKAVSRRAKPVELSDELFSVALDHLPQGVLILDRKASAQGLPILFANAGFCKMIGRDASELVGSRHGTFCTDVAELERLLAWTKKARSGATYSAEGELLHRDGHVMRAAWTFSLIHLGAASGSCILASYQDMTEKHRLREALQRAQKVDALGRLAGGVAHDLNNLMAVVSGYSQLMSARYSENADILRDAGEILKACQKALDLTREMLVIGGRHDFSPLRLDLNQYVRENAYLLSTELEGAGELNVAPCEGELVVEFDFDMLQQVLVNLVFKARGSLRHQGRVTLSTSLRSLGKTEAEALGVPSGRYAQLSVSDNGVGMDSETLEHLFEPYYGCKGAGKGGGLSLALVYSILQQGGAFIRVRSTLLVGSTFDILFPLIQEEENALAVLQPTMSATQSSSGRETVLLVESDVILAKMLSGMLASGGCRVIEAGAMKDVEGLMRHEHGGLNLLIASLSENEEIVRVVRDLLVQHPKMKILCTTDCGKRCNLEAHNLHCHLCMPKPFAISELLRAARTLLTT